MPTDPRLEELVTFLKKVPAVDPRFESGFFTNGCWRNMKFRIDIGHPLAWRVVQELGHILNFISLSEPLPTAFKPVSPPVYLNGGRAITSPGSSNRPSLRSYPRRAVIGCLAGSHGPWATRKNGSLTKTIEP